MNKATPSLRTLSSAAIALSLAACGGGDDGSSGGSAAAPSGKAEGAYAGSSSTGYDVQFVVLENDVLWGYYSRGNTLYGMVHGAGASGNGSYTMSGGRDFYFAGGLVYTGGVSATYVARSSIQGLVNPVGAPAYTFTATAGAVLGYDYHRAASLAAIAGSWPGFFAPTGETGTVNVSPAGAVNGTTSTGCVFSGSAVPRASGKNVYDVTISFGPSPCLLPNRAASGIGIITERVPGTRQLLAGVVDGTRAFGAAFVGTR